MLFLNYWKNSKIMHFQKVIAFFIHSKYSYILDARVNKSNKLFDNSHEGCSLRVF